MSPGSESRSGGAASRDDQGSSAPSFEGLPYLRALREHRERGGELSLRIRLTRPAYPCAGAGTLRVVAVRPRTSPPEWVLAYERYVRLPGSAEHRKSSPS